MKNKIKNQIMLACLSASLVASAAAVTTVAVNAKAEETLVSSDLTMNVGASLYLEEISGLKFSYTVKDYTEETHGDKNYGMLIVPYDYLAKAGITDLTLATNDYVPTLQAAVGDTIANAPIVVDGLQPTAAGLVEYSIGDLYEDNYARAFFGIGFEATETAEGTAYEYAVQNDNVRSVFEVANLALNKLHYGEWTESEEDVKEQALLESKETDVLNPFLTKGFAFVYGNAATPTIASATYVGGEIVPVVDVEKEKDIDLGIHWNYSVTEGDTVAEVTAEGKIKGLSRGQTTVTLSLGDVKHETATASVLKDATEFQIYNDSENAYLFRDVNAPVVDGTYTAQLKGGYWTDVAADSGYADPGYLAIKNPNSEDGKYTVGASGSIYVDFYFKGNNMPTVEFFGTTIESLSLGKGGDTTSTKNAPTGYVVFNGAAKADTYTRWDKLQAAGKDVDTVVETDESGTPTGVLEGFESHSNWTYVLAKQRNFYRYGISDYGNNTNKFTRANYGKVSVDNGKCFLRVVDQSGPMSIWNNSTSTLSNWALTSYTDSSKFSMYSLMKEGEEQYWHYKVGLKFSSKGVPALQATLYKTDAEGNHVDADTSTADTVDAFATFTKYKSTSLSAASSGRSGYVIVYGALKGSASAAGDRYNTQIAYKLPY